MFCLTCIVYNVFLIIKIRLRGVRKMIFLLEDDGNIRKLVEYTLKANDMDVKSFGLPSEFWEAMENDKLPELILLDIMLPQEDGMDILRKIRSDSLTKSIPVIMLTAKGTEFDKVIGLDCGADDYVCKPFSPLELVARIKAVKRRANHAIRSDSSTYKINDVIVVDSQSHRVEVDGEEISLTPKEFELIEILAENRGNVLSREELLRKIWGYNFDGETRTVDVHIRKLRQKLGDYADYIETVKGIGYCIKGENDE